MTDPIERKKYKAQLAAWRLKNPKTRAASLFFASKEPSDVSVEQWLLDNKENAINAIRELDEELDMDVEDLLLNWLDLEEELVLGGERVSDLDRLMIQGESSLNCILRNEDIYNVANTDWKGSIDKTRQYWNNGILENVSGVLCDKAGIKTFFQSGIETEEMTTKVLAFMPFGVTVITKARCGLDERTLDALLGSTLPQPCADYELLENIKALRPDITILNLLTYFCRIFNGFPSFRLDYLVKNCETLKNFRFHDAVEDCKALRALLGLISEILFYGDALEE
jgi:hypothetical protein